VSAVLLINELIRKYRSVALGADPQRMYEYTPTSSDDYDDDDALDLRFSWSRL
jgi:hypothetical protein